MRRMPRSWFSYKTDPNEAYRRKQRAKKRRKKHFVFADLFPAERFINLDKDEGNRRKDFGSRPQKVYDATGQSDVSDRSP
jgi:hypothetical protein